MVELLNPKSSGLVELSESLKASGSLCLDVKQWNAASSIHNQLKEFNQHVWLSSSGSYERKLIAVSKDALRTSAISVNKWLNINSMDCWALSLPLDHIGGLSILVRAQEGNFKVSHYQEKWDAFKYCNFVAKNRCSIGSLVPTQLFDIVSRELLCPPSLRALVIGGAHLSPVVYFKARQLNWPVLPSYGLTECCSQVATASLDSLAILSKTPTLKILPHLTCKLNPERRLMIGGGSILSCHVKLDPQKEANLVQQDSLDFYSTNDLARINLSNDETGIEIIGRADRQIKIRGWLVSLDEIEKKIRSFFDFKSIQPLLALTAKDDLREGFSLSLVVSSASRAVDLLSDLNAYLEGEDSHNPKIAEIIEIDSFPLLENGKIDYRTLNKIFT